MYICAYVYLLFFGVVLLNMFENFVFIFLGYFCIYVFFSCNFTLQCTFCYNSISVLLSREVNNLQTSPTIPAVLRLEPMTFG